jgi:hypothetical protein
VVAPVTGPFFFDREIPKIVDIYGTPYAYVGAEFHRKWYRQKRPRIDPLPYDFTYKAVVNESYLFPPNYRSTANCPIFEADKVSGPLSKAYGKFKDKVNEQSMWAVNLIEGERSVKMIANRAGQLLRFSRHVARGNFGRAARELGLAAKPKGVSTKHSFSNNWLEYHFGWEPLVKDIGSGLATVCDPYMPRYVSGSATGHWTGYYTDPDHSGSSYRVFTGKGVTKVRMGAYVQVTNPNAFLLDQLGFTNPAAIAWELVPFSFVVDWFSNVGQVLSAYTDFMGTSLTRAFTTTTQRIDASETWIGGQSAVPVWVRGVAFIHVNTMSFFMKRELGISTPSLFLRPFKGFSVVRGATAIALLTQFLKH